MPLQRDDLAMRLYSDITRDDVGFKPRTEAAYSYEDRSARPELARIRNTMQSWFEDLPVGPSLDILKRYQSRDDGQHYSAFLEIVCHRLLQGHGIGVEIHSGPGGAGVHPDFLGTSEKGFSLYAESTAVYNSKSDQGLQARVKALLDYLDQHLRAADFVLEVELLSAGTEAPPLRAIRDSVNRRLSGLDYGLVQEAAIQGGFGSVPEWTVSHGGWSLSIKAFPKPADRRGRASRRAIGVEFGGVRWVDARTPLLRALRGKAKKYGHLGKPYIVFVDVLSDPFVLPDEIDIVDALFGQEVYGVDPASGSLIPRREPNGLWRSERGPTYTRVSCVAIAEQLVPFSLGKAPMVLWHNPWAEYPLDLSFWKGDQNYVDPRSQRIETIRGMSVAEMLGLPPGWPMDAEST